MENTRSAYSLRRLAQLAERLQATERLLNDHPLSVYVTGSYGREEAWSGSDLDVFFLHEHSAGQGPFPYIAFIELSAPLIAAARDMKFPEFTDNGRYLEVHDVGRGRCL